MEMSSSSAAVLTRPRLAILTAAAAFCVSIYFVHQSRETSLHPERHGGTLHRSNAVRRHRRRPTNASESSAAESHADENVNINELRMTDGETVAADEQQDDEWWNDPASMPQQRAGQNIVSLLFRVSEDNARRNAYVHRGCMCNACGIVPIRGIRYRCANCADFDLCETCESQGLHIKTHIFYKVKIPAPPFGPRSMQPVWYPGDPDTCLRNLPRTLMVKLSRETGFERPELEAFWEQWTFIANTEWREDPDDLCLAMDRKTFERCLVPSGGHRHTAPNLIHDRMFAFYDTNDDDLIGFTEFLHGLSYRKRKDKLRRIFDGYDVDRDGLVSRRDFLRIFRAYYVLYKQMHRDILEGLDDQVMNSTEAHQLVTSRQPLSSLFGREGRFPQADHGRHMEGKMYHSNGDVTIGDGRDRVVNEDQPDTGDRDEILTSLFNHRGSHGLFIENPFSPTSENFQSPNGEIPSHTYFDALLNPPTRVDELPALLVGEREPESMFINEEEVQQNGEGGRESGSSDGESVPNHNETNGDVQDSAAQESSAHAIGERRLSEVLGRQRDDEQWTNRIPTEDQLRARHQAVVAKSQQAAMNRKTRVAARKKLLERWKRRQFYLDEEEGALPPDGWKDDDDVLVNTNGGAESSATPQILSPRSRSSSKVRFAEDTDDYEIRSNPSTSSRSVPERWGGIDIPDAERDAGKEILYQVTQQAFNELLDVLFKAKEDLAVRAAETKADRDRHRVLFESIDLVEEARKKSEQAKTVENGWAEDTTVGGESTPLRDRPLEELLEVTGYSINRPHEEAAVEEPMPELEVVEEILADEQDTDKVKSPEPTVKDAPAAESTDESTLDRDPTMPQFRPNSIADLQHPFNVTVPVATDSEMSTPSTDDASLFETWPSGHLKWIKTKKSKGLKKPLPTPIPHSTLVEWKKLDMAEEEAKARGGWGRLKYHEFEEICRKEESGSNRLDYLGTWIDFCIP